MCLLIKHRQNCCDCLLYRIFCKRKYVYSFYGSSCFFGFFSAAHQNLLNSVVDMDSVGTWGVWLRSLAWIHGWRGSNFGVGRVSPFNFDVVKVLVWVGWVTWHGLKKVLMFCSFSSYWKCSLYVFVSLYPLCLMPCWMKSHRGFKMVSQIFWKFFHQCFRQISLFQIYLKGIIKLCGYLISRMEQN